MGSTRTESPSSKNISPSPRFKFQRWMSCAGTVICFFDDREEMATISPPYFSRLLCYCKYIRYMLKSKDLLKLKGYAKASRQ